jgi:Na+/melibiose symporter-like transporter
MSPSACSFIVCCFPLYFTTCFDLHDHLQVCRILHIFKDSASLPFFFYVVTLCVFSICVLFLCYRQTHKQENTKNTKENSTGTRHKRKTWQVWPHRKGRESKKQRSRILKHMKINIWRILHAWRWPCRPKHVVKEWKPTYNKAARRRRHNLQY